MTVAILWGDGTALDTTTGTVGITGGTSTGINPIPNIAAGTGVNFKVTGNHTYTEEGTFTITFAVVDADGAAFTLTTTATIRDVPISSIGAPSIPGVVGVQLGTPLPGGGTAPPDLAVITDTNTGGGVVDFPNGSITVDWGDGTPISTLGDGTIGVVQEGGIGVVLLFGRHTYMTPGDFQISMIIRDTGGATKVADSEAIITPGLPMPAALPPLGINAIEGQPQIDALVGSFTDANPLTTALDYGATIDWGDGTVDTGVISQPNGVGAPFLVSGTHTYNDPDPSGVEMDGFPVVVTITDVGGSVAIATSQANVFDPVLIDPGVNVQAVQLALFQGKVASFSSGNRRATAGDFTALVNWGDGQSSSGAIVSDGSGGFIVLGDHTYAQAGTFSLSTTVRDDEGQSVSDSSTATVSAAPIVAQGLTIATAGKKRFAGSVATFTDPNPAVAAGGFSVLIDWGDGSLSRGVVVALGSSAGGSTFKVLGSLVYSGRKRYVGSVAIVDSGGAQALVPMVADLRRGHRATGSSRLLAGQKSHASTPGLVLRSSHPKGPHARFKAVRVVHHAAVPRPVPRAIHNKTLPGGHRSDK